MFVLCVLCYNRACVVCFSIFESFVYRTRRVDVPLLVRSTRIVGTTHASFVLRNKSRAMARPMSSWVANVEKGTPVILQVTRRRPLVLPRAPRLRVGCPGMVDYSGSGWSRQTASVAIRTRSRDRSSYVKCGRPARCAWTYAHCDVPRRI